MTTGGRLCGAVCPSCAHCCADLLKPYHERRRIVAYKARCQKCEALYIVELR